MLKIALLLLAALAPLMPADAPAKNPPAAAPPDLRTVMTLRGKQILDEAFTPESWKANWGTYKSDCQLIDGHLRVGSPPDAGHPAEANYHAPLHDTVIQFRFRCDGAAWMGMQISDDKAAQHICNLLITPTQATINRVTGWGPTTRNASLDHQTLAFERERWYMVLIELCGNDYLVHIDDRCVLYGQAEGMDIAKPRLSLISSGDFAWYDHVKVWDATPDPLWPKRKEEVLKLKAKHQ